MPRHAIAEEDAAPVVDEEGQEERGRRRGAHRVAAPQAGRAAHHREGRRQARRQRREGPVEGPRREQRRRRRRRPRSAVTFETIVAGTDVLVQSRLWSLLGPGADDADHMLDMEFELA